MPEMVISEFSLDSTLELVADHFNALSPASTLFRTASAADRVTLAMGLIDQFGTAQTIAQIVGGVIDEYELLVRPNSVNARVRGRDQSALTLDRIFKKRYIREPEVGIVETAGDLETIDEVKGQFMASQIAADAAASVGLTLDWGVLDYQVLETFEANGRVIDILKTLIKPWTYLEPFRADIYLRGTMLIAKPRPFPFLEIDHMISLVDMRRGEITIRKRKMKKVGRLIIHVAMLGDALIPNPDILLTPGIGNLVIQGTLIEEETVEMFGPTGSLISLIHTIAMYQMPARNLKSQIKTTFTLGGVGLILSARETITNDWRQPFFDTSGQTGNPEQKNGAVIRERVDPSDETKLFRVWETMDIGYDYNFLGFQTGESQKTKKLNLAANIMENNALSVKTMREKANLMVEQITENYTFNTSDQIWVLQQRDTQTQGGNRPGGPGRAQPISASTTATPGTAGYRTVTLITVLSTDADAFDVEINEPNLTAELAQVIINQFQTVQGLYEYEVSFSGVGMPFLIRGKTIKITDIILDDGLPLLLPTLLMTEGKSQYKEEPESSAYTSSMRAFGWGA